jgi:hypothetical protein
MSHIENGTEYRPSSLVPERDFSKLEGDLLTLAELLGLPREQSEALKSQIRQRIWGGFAMRYPIIPADKVPEAIKLTVAPAIEVKVK